MPVASIETKVFSEKEGPRKHRWWFTYEEMIEDDLMGNEFSNKWWGHVVPWVFKVIVDKSGFFVCANLIPIKIKAK